MDLRLFQQKAIAALEARGIRGTVKAPTGSGKSMIAMHFVKKLNCTCLVIVPTIALQTQWIDELKALGIECGRFGGGFRDQTSILIGVRNSVIKIVFDVDLLILDECHRYQSPQSIKPIFEMSKFKYIIALSATPERLDDMHKVLFEVAPLVYTYSVDEAIEDDVISDYIIDNHMIVMEEAEEIRYRLLDMKIREKFQKYGSFEQLRYAAMAGDFGAVHVMKAIAARKKIIYNSISKVHYTVQLLKTIQKTIVFSESIEALEQVKVLMPECLIYHSGLTAIERKQTIEMFKKSEKGVLLTAKSLDEGLNIVDISEAIIMSGTSTARQFTQRIGRTLRKHGDKIAKIHVIVLKDTKDEEWNALAQSQS